MLRVRMCCSASAGACRREWFEQARTSGPESPEQSFGSNPVIVDTRASASKEHIVKDKN